MHTYGQLESWMIQVRLAGRRATVEELFPGWGRDDRFGMVIDAPLGAAGANLLIQAAVVAFYDAFRSAGGSLRVYPEIHFFHVGQMHGDMSSYDAWPPYKEVLVEAQSQLAYRVAERGVTWLAVPEGRPSHRPDRLTHEQDVTLNGVESRLRGGFVYGTQGRASGADAELRSASPVTEENLGFVLDPGQYVESLQRDYPDFAYLVPLAERRAGEVAQDIRTAVAAARREDGRAQGGSEFYRRLSAAETTGLLPTPAPVTETSVGYP